MYKIMKIYYDKVTGEAVWNVSYNQDVMVDFDHDYATVKVLNERVKESLSLMVLSDGQYIDDFAECTGYRINPITKVIEFTYPTEPEVPPVYSKPLSTEFIMVKKRLQLTEQAIDFIIMNGGM